MFSKYYFEILFISFYVQLSNRPTQGLNHN